MRKRKDVLLSEFSRRHKSNVVNDRRFGEKDTTGMTIEDVPLLKFQKQRRKKDLYTI